MEAPPPPAASSEPPPASAAPPPAPSEAPAQPSPSPSPAPAPDHAQPPPSSTPPPSAAPSTSQNPPQPQSQSIPLPQSSSQPPQTIQQHPRPPVVRNRPPTSFPHFAHHLPSSAQSSSGSITAPASSSSSPSPSSASAASQRGGLAIGVPAHSAHIPRAQQSSVAAYSSFGASPAFSQPFSALSRMPEQSTANSQVRQPIQGIQNIGMIGSLSTSSQMRPGGATGPPQPRFVQPTTRASSQSANQNKFPNSGLIRGPSVVSSTTMSSIPQQSLVSSQGKQMPAPSAPSSSFRPQMKSHALQQRPHQLQQNQQPISTSSHQQQLPSSQQQQQQQKQQQQQQFHQHASSRQPQEHYNQPNQQLRNQQQLLQQPARPVGPITTKPNPPASVQTNISKPGAINPVVGTDAAESGNQILSKRSIRELVSQIDPSENLDSEVEDVLVEIAEDFVESVTTFACSLAKHRKSTTLEAKDILLHVERNWNLTLPGFGGDEIKCYKKQFTNDIHKERLAVIKKSMAATGDASNTKNAPGGQLGSSSKSHPKVYCMQFVKNSCHDELFTCVNVIGERTVRKSIKNLLCMRCRWMKTDVYKNVALFCLRHASCATSRIHLQMVPVKNMESDAASIHMALPRLVLFSTQSKRKSRGSPKYLIGKNPSNQQQPRRLISHKGKTQLSFSFFFSSSLYDSMAIMMAFQMPEVEVLGLTTIFGNVTTANATRNALLLCEIAGRPEVPVAEGTHKPLNGEEPSIADFIHGSDGIGNLFLPPPVGKKIEESAAEFLVEKVSQYPGEVSILALGPLTNLALAIKRDSSFASKVKKLVILGGAFFSSGNVNPAAEANIYGDPEAADIVFTCGADIVVVGINITTQVKLTDDELSELRNSQGRHAKILCDMCKFYRDWHVESNGVYGVFLHDPACFAALVRPDLFTYITGVVRVEVQGICAGHTLMDQGLRRWNTSNPWTGYSPASVAWTVDVPGVLSFVKQLLTKP
ncbi:putative uridine nucleosidase 1 [Canna indica]|uniref:uridine nucleosidase n=1 Tax=Canna indica TaxID=4628 RepID=A0AAQ3QK39_9LILI|nr:putative uridine nucleosidase 1 [Canna indica]